MNKDEYQKMADFEKVYWWHKGKHHLLDSLMHQYSPGDDLNILEVGCGGGELTKRLKEHGSVTGLDVSEDSIELCKQQGIEDLILDDIAEMDVTPMESKYDLVLALDVLEHIQDDEAAMQNIHKTLTPEGKFFINVPAHKFLWSQHDEALMHKRRYTRFELTSKLKRAGFKIDKETYYVTTVFPAIVLFRTYGNLFTRSAYPKTSYVLLPEKINEFLYSLLKLEAKFIKDRNLPIGTTIVVVASKA